MTSNKISHSYSGADNPKSGSRSRHIQPPMSQEEKLDHVKYILTHGEVPPLKAAAHALPDGDVSAAADVPTAQPPRTSSEITEIPAGYKTLKDLEPLCKNRYSFLKEYWPYLIGRTGSNIPVELRKSGVIVDIETLGLGKNKLELQYIHTRAPSGKPLILLNVGVDNEYLGRWLDAAVGYNHQSVFDRAEIKIIQTTPLNLPPQSIIGPTR